MGTTRRCSRTERGAAALGTILVVAGAVVAGAGTGFAAQRIVGGGDGGGGTAGAVTVAGGAPVYGCPGDPTVADVHHGDRVFAVAVHDELDGWLQIRNPEDASERWWIEDRFVDLDAGTSDLDRADCEGIVEEAPTDEVAAPDETTTSGPDESTTTTEVDETTTSTTASTVPGETTTSTTATPGQATTTTKPKTTTTTTKPPPSDTSGPSLSVGRTQSAIWESYPGACPNDPKSSKITANASDPSGVASVRATWSVGNYNENESMGSGPYSATFGPYGYPTISDGTQQTVTVTVTATDGKGNKTVKTTSVVLHSAGQCFG